jgi:AraC family transcriptional regulator of adaptative response/methylated-DNA-[protein]-cysteine methyltransferase
MSTEDYERVARAIRFLESSYRSQPALAEVARHVHLSEFHFQRLFRRWVGISPKRFLQFLTVDHAKRLLRESRSLLDVSFASGLSGPGRLHDHFVALEAVTPGEYKRRGTGLTIACGFHPTPFGECLLALTDRGICGLAFVEDRDESMRDLRRNWTAATFLEDRAKTRDVAERIFAPGAAPAACTLVVGGTNFQVKVWEALLRIPRGALASYEEVARRVGRPGAARAVGHAVGRNPIAYLIPCHRVITKSGRITGYRWGTVRKKALIGWEAAHRDGLDGDRLGSAGA